VTCAEKIIASLALGASLTAAVVVYFGLRAAWDAYQYSLNDERRDPHSREH
jgi:hypothetical protein